MCVYTINIYDTSIQDMPIRKETKTTTFRCTLYFMYLYIYIYIYTHTPANLLQLAHTHTPANLLQCENTHTHTLTDHLCDETTGFSGPI